MGGINLIDELEDNKNKQENLINSQVSNAKILLAENEANKIAVLKALGLDSEIKVYEEAKGRSIDRKTIEKEFGRDVFHIDEIEKLCIKYDLRFLHTSKYNGSITSDLARKIVDFAKKHELRIGVNGDTWGGDKDKFFILAPRENFRKEIKPIQDKDPILFFSTGKLLYKVVYSWGYSLRATRLLKGWRKRNARNRFLYVWSLISLLYVSILGFIGAPLWMAFSIGGALAALTSLLFLPWGDGIELDHAYFSEYGWNESPITLI